MCMANSEGRVSHYLEPPVAPYSFPRVFHSCTESRRRVHNEAVYVVKLHSHSERCCGHSEGHSRHSGHLLVRSAELPDCVVRL